MNVSFRFKLLLIRFLMPAVVFLFVDPRQATGPVWEPLPAAHVGAADIRTPLQPPYVLIVQRAGPQVQLKQSRSRIAQAVTPVRIYLLSATAF